MGAVWMRARAEVRARWRALVSAGVLAGLFGAATLATLAGAQRTQTAYPRFLERQRAYDVLVFDATLFAPVFWKPDFEALARLPYVDAAIKIDSGYIHASGDLPAGAGFYGSHDPRYATTVQRPLLVRGRFPRGADEIAVPHFADEQNENDYRDLGVFHVGDRLTLDAHGRPVTLKVVGETVFPGELPPRPQWGWLVAVGPAFVEKYARGCDFGGPRCLVDFIQPMMLLRFKSRSDIDTFERDVRGMTGGKVLATQELRGHTRSVLGSTDLQAVALRLLSLFIGLTGAMIVGQLLARELALGAADSSVLRALGMSRSQQFRLGLVRIFPVAIVGAVLSVGIAWLASPIFPRGSVRLVEPSLLAFDPKVLGLGGLGVAAAVLTLSVLPAWRAAVAAGRDATQVSRPSGIASRFAAAGMSPAAVAGARLALERGRGRTGVPVLSSLAVVSLGIASFVAATTFAASLERIISVPELYGKSWDDVITAQSDRFLDDPAAQNAFTERASRTLARERDFEAVAKVDGGAPLQVFSRNGPVSGIPVLGLAITNLKGSLFPPIVEGRAPSDLHEVALGRRMIRALGISLDPSNPPEIEIGIQGGEARVRYRVVGRGVIPPLGNYGELGFGILFSDLSAIVATIPDADISALATDLIVRWRDGADPAAVLARYQKTLPDVRIGEGLTGGKFADAVNFGGVQGAPLVVGGVLAALGAAALAHVLVTSIRRRRRDIAVLKTIGFVRGQARRAVAWQATIMVLVSAAVGVPLGLVGGRGLWMRVADDIGVLPRPHVSVIVLALLAPALIVLANLIAAVPARAAARTQPALILRTE